MKLNYINSDDPRIMKTVKGIYAAFMDCLSETSYTKINIKMICEKANINRSTFYTYYEDKHHLFKCILRDIIESATNTCFEVTNLKDESIPINALEVLVDYKFLFNEIFYGKDDHSLVPVLHEVLSEDLLEKILLHFNGKKYSATDLSVVISFYTGAIASVLAWWVSHDNLISFDNLQTHFKTLMAQLYDHADMTLY